MRHEAEDESRALEHNAITYIDFPVQRAAGREANAFLEQLRERVLVEPTYPQVWIREGVADAVPAALPGDGYCVADLPCLREVGVVIGGIELVLAEAESRDAA